MAFYDNIPLHETTQRNHANVFNEPLEKIIANIKDNKQAIEDLDLKADEIINMFDKYTKTDDLNEMLKHGVKGDQGEPGDSAYDLAVDSGAFVGTLNEWLESLKGEKGDKGDPGEVTEDQLNEVKTDLEEKINNIPKVTKVSELENDAGYVTEDDLPQNLSDLTNDCTFLTEAEINNKVTHEAQVWKLNCYMPDGNPYGTDGKSVVAQDDGTQIVISDRDHVLPTRVNFANNADTVQNLNVTINYTPELHIPAFGGVTPLEVGQWIDFHHSDGTDGVDFVGRIYINKGGEPRGLYYTDYVDASHNMNITQEILNLKTISVNGKQTVASAINGVLGTSLSSSTSYTDMAYYISIMGGSSGGFADITTTTCERVGTGTYTCRGISFYTSTDASITWSTPAVAKYIRFISGAYGANTTFRSYDTNPNINTYVSLNANGYACIIFDNTITVTINDVTTTDTEYVYILN